VTEQHEERIQPTDSRYIGGSTRLKRDHPSLAPGIYIAGENGAHRNLTDDEIAAGIVKI
jgi:hypothetical protein